MAVRQRQLLRCWRYPQLRSRHRSRTDNNANRESAKQRHGRSLRSHDQTRLRSRQPSTRCSDRDAATTNLVRSLQRASPAQGSRISFTTRVHRSSRNTLTVSGRSGATTDYDSRNDQNDDDLFEIGRKHQISHGSATEETFEVSVLLAHDRKPAHLPLDPWLSRLVPRKKKQNPCCHQKSPGEGAG